MAGELKTALGEMPVPLVPGSPIGRLGDEAAAAEAAKAAPVAAVEAVKVAVDPAVEAAKAVVDPAVEAAKVAVDPAVEAAKAAALTAAEKSVADAKTPEEKAAAQKTLDELKSPADKPGIAPEKYADFKLPDGVLVDKEALDRFAPLAKELNLSQSQAQKLIDFEAARVQKNAADHTTAWNKLLNDRLVEAKSDPEIGGAKFDKTVADARVFLREFGTPKLQAFLSTSDAGSQVELIRAMAKAGVAIGNDTFHVGNKPIKEGDKTVAERIFGTQPTK